MLVCLCDALVSVHICVFVCVCVRKKNTIKQKGIYVQMFKTFH